MQRCRKNSENKNLLAPQKEEKCNSKHFNLLTILCLKLTVIKYRHQPQQGVFQHCLSNMSFTVTVVLKCTAWSRQRPHCVPLFPLLFCSLFYIFFFLQPLSTFFILFFFPSCSHLQPIFRSFFAHNSGICITEIPVKQLWCSRLLIFVISLYRKGR